ncbi:MAG: transposase [Candidatus Omnitrophica bacterium]|nr:transposase [Candidatus Omnitrophota bacterium]
MARPLRIEYPGAFYHVIARGNEKREIFSSESNLERFLEYLAKAYRRYKIKVHAYCLMHNHYHLLVETPYGNLSRSMQYINSSYTTYYNVAKKRVGHLFQGRYKGILVDKDAYIQELSRYIHLNPVKAKRIRIPEQFRWSSYQYYIGMKRLPEYMDIQTTLSYFKNRKEYREFVEEGMSKGIVNLEELVKAGCILGDEQFVEGIKGRYLDKTKKVRDLPGLQELKKEWVSAELIIKLVDEEKDILEKEKRKLSVYFLRKYTGETLEEIAFRFRHKISSTAVSKIVTRIEERKKKDKGFRRRLEKVEGKVSNGEV